MSLPGDVLLKPLIWLGSSLEDLRQFPEPVQDHMGYAPCAAPRGGNHRDAKALTGFGGAGVMEVIWDFRGDRFRAAYVLHAFQKKARAGRATPRADIELVRQRLREAEQIAKGRRS